MDDLHYRGQNAMDVQRTGHSIGTRALLVVLATLPGRKKLSASSKACCLRLLTQLVRTAVESRGTSGVNGGCVSCTIFSKDWRPHGLDLQFSSAGLTSGLGSLEDCNKKAAQSWKQLTQEARAWCGHVLASTLQLATLWDVIVWSTWAKHHPALPVWSQVCKHLFPKLIFFAGHIVDEFVGHLAAHLAHSLCPS